MELKDLPRPSFVPAHEAKYGDRFLCRCGVELNDSQTAPDSDRGMLFWDTEKEQLEEKTRTLFSGFLKALRSKKDRLAWLENYYGVGYEGDLNDVEVLLEVLFHEECRWGHEVLRCPGCERLYVAPKSSERGWKCFKPDDEQKEAE
jgi:hypothetical protein